MHTRGLTISTFAPAQFKVHSISATVHIQNHTNFVSVMQRNDVGWRPERTNACILHTADSWTRNFMAGMFCSLLTRWTCNSYQTNEGLLLNYRGAVRDFNSFPKSIATAYMKPV